MEKELSARQPFLRGFLQARFRQDTGQHGYKDKLLEEAFGLNSSGKAKFKIITGGWGADSKPIATGTGKEAYAKGGAKKCYRPDNDLCEPFRQMSSGSTPANKDITTSFRRRPSATILPERCTFKIITDRCQTDSKIITTNTDRGA